MGLGIAFSEEFGIIGIDIDKCLDENGQPNEVASGVLAELSQISTYIEVSPSGRGLHIFLRGTLPSGGRKNSETGVEMYSTKRYFTMTGNRWHNCADEIAVDNGAIAAIHMNYIKKKKSQKKATTSNNQTIPRGTSCLSDEQLLEKAMATDKTFEPLWEGNHGSYN
jgi:primase-polymerase (primpol)-like protein